MSRRKRRRGRREKRRPKAREETRASSKFERRPLEELDGVGDEDKEEEEGGRGKRDTQNTSASLVGSLLRPHLRPPSLGLDLNAHVRESKLKFEFIFELGPEWKFGSGFELEFKFEFEQRILRPRAEITSLERATVIRNCFIAGHQLKGSSLRPEVALSLASSSANLQFIRVESAQASIRTTRDAFTSPTRDISRKFRLGVEKNAPTTRGSSTKTIKTKANATTTTTTTTCETTTKLKGDDPESQAIGDRAYLEPSRSSRAGPPRGGKGGAQPAACELEPDLFLGRPSNIEIDLVHRQRLSPHGNDSIVGVRLVPKHSCRTRLFSGSRSSIGTIQGIESTNPACRGFCQAHRKCSIELSLSSETRGDEKFVAPPSRSIPPSQPLVETGAKPSEAVARSLPNFSLAPEEWLSQIANSPALVGGAIGRAGGRRPLAARSLTGSEQPPKWTQFVPDQAPGATMIDASGMALAEREPFKIGARGRPNCGGVVCIQQHPQQQRQQLQQQQQQQLRRQPEKEKQKEPERARQQWSLDSGKLTINQTDRALRGARQVPWGAWRRLRDTLSAWRRPLLWVLLGLATLLAACESPRPPGGASRQVGVAGALDEALGALMWPASLIRAVSCSSSQVRQVARHLTPSDRDAWPWRHFRSKSPPPSKGPGGRGRARAARAIEAFKWAHSRVRSDDTGNHYLGVEHTDPSGKSSTSASTTSGGWPEVTPEAAPQVHEPLFEPLPGPPPHRWPFVGLVSFMFIGATGNILVCMAVLRERRLQTATNYFLLSLAVADLLVCTLVMPFGIIYELYGRWPFDWRVCNIWVTCDVLTCSSSILHMCFISVGRYLGIRNPLHARQANLFVSRRAVLWRIAIAWLSSALIASPVTMMTLYDQRNIRPSPGECAISNKYFLMFGSMLAFFIPMFVMVPSYVMTVRLLSRRAKFVRNNSLLLTNSTACVVGSQQPNNNNNNNGQNNQNNLHSNISDDDDHAHQNQNQGKGQPADLRQHRQAGNSGLSPSQPAGRRVGRTSGCEVEPTSSQTRDGYLLVSWRGSERAGNLEEQEPIATGSAKLLISLAERTGQKWTSPGRSGPRVSFSSSATDTKLADEISRFIDEEGPEDDEDRSANSSELQHSEVEATSKGLQLPASTRRVVRCRDCLPSGSPRALELPGALDGRRAHKAGGQGSRSQLHATPAIKQDSPEVSNGFPENSDALPLLVCMDAEKSPTTKLADSSSIEISLTDYEQCSQINRCRRDKADSRSHKESTSNLNQKDQSQNGSDCSSSQRLDDSSGPQIDFSGHDKATDIVDKNSGHTQRSSTSQADDELQQSCDTYTPQPLIIIDRTSQTGLDTDCCISSRSNSSISSCGVCIKYKLVSGGNSSCRDVARSQVSESPKSSNRDDFSAVTIHHDCDKLESCDEESKCSNVKSSESLHIDGSRGESEVIKSSQDHHHEHQHEYCRHNNRHHHHNHRRHSNHHHGNHRHHHHHHHHHHHKHHHHHRHHHRHREHQHQQEQKHKSRDKCRHRDEVLNISQSEPGKSDEIRSGDENVGGENEKRINEVDATDGVRELTVSDPSMNARDQALNSQAIIEKNSIQRLSRLVSDLESNSKLPPELECENKSSQSPNNSKMVKDELDLGGSSTVGRGSYPKIIEPADPKNNLRLSKSHQDVGLDTKVRAGRQWEANLITQSSSSCNNTTSGYPSNEPQMIRYLGSSMQVRSEQKATKVLGVVFFTFVICWTPFFVINFTQAFVERDELGKWISNEMMTTFLWLGYISSTINPVIYTVFNRNFRRAFRELLLCRSASNSRHYHNRQLRLSEMNNKSFRYSQYGTSNRQMTNNNSIYNGGSGKRHNQKSDTINNNPCSKNDNPPNVSKFGEPNIIASTTVAKSTTDSEPSPKTSTTLTTTLTGSGSTPTTRRAMLTIDNRLAPSGRQSSLRHHLSGRLESSTSATGPLDASYSTETNALVDQNRRVGQEARFKKANNEDSGQQRSGHSIASPIMKLGPPLINTTYLAAKQLKLAFQSPTIILSSLSASVMGDRSTESKIKDKRTELKCKELIRVSNPATNESLRRDNS